MKNVQQLPGLRSDGMFQLIHSQTETETKVLASRQYASQCNMRLMLWLFQLIHSQTETETKVLQVDSMPHNVT
jgi:hypothetical protein